MTWVVIALVAWPVVGAAAALLIGRAIRLADRRAGTTLPDEPNVVVDDHAAPPARQGTGDPRHL